MDFTAVHIAIDKAHDETQAIGDALRGIKDEFRKLSEKRANAIKALLIIEDRVRSGQTDEAIKRIGDLIMYL